MRRLILMRHAKSSWGDPDQYDIDRPLNARGRLAATLMGAWLADEGLAPDHALLSPAVRVEQTWARLAASGGFKAASTVVDRLFHADPDTARAALQDADPEAQTVLLLGHEPGSTALLRHLSDGSESGGCRRAYEKFPTAALAVLELQAKRWADLAKGGARCVRFVCPKDLI
ncbi:MAG: histidine phosphatase family protein [Pseudomonadota bacterium]